MTEVQEAILKDRFYLPHESTWYDVCERVARTWGDTPELTARIYEMMRDRKGLPNTPAIANAGRGVQMGSACYVLPVNDSLTDGPSSIMQTLKDAAAVHKSGGGTGFSFGRIRGRGTPVGSTGRPAPGAVNVLQLYSDAIARVTQAGMRPGANMGILPCDHPDIMEFISCKEQEGDITNFNISVAVTDEFMRSIKPTEYFDNGQKDYWNPVWDAIVDGAWRNGEPGIIFIDTVNRTALHPEEIEATNPCGEVPLRPYEACVLGSVNIAAHTTPHGIMWGELGQTVRTMVRLLDNIIEYQDYPLPEIEREQKFYRKIGVGVMGYADALLILGHQYGTHAALDVAEGIADFIQKISYDESRKLADEKGVYAGFYEGELPYRNPDGSYFYGSSARGLPYRRNLMCQVIAPTGTISRLAGCSFGIEPIMSEHQVSYVVGGVFDEGRHPEADNPAFVISTDVDPKLHVATQAAFQRYTDQAVSKTVNLPHSATREDVAEIYKYAWETGCKGITVLREHSRDNVVIADNSSCVDGVCTL